MRVIGATRTSSVISVLTVVYFCAFFAFALSQSPYAESSLIVLSIVAGLTLVRSFFIGLWTNGDHLVSRSWLTTRRIPLRRTRFVVDEPSVGPGLIGGRSTRLFKLAAVSAIFDGTVVNLANTATSHRGAERIVRELARRQGGLGADADIEIPAGVDGNEACHRVAVDDSTIPVAVTISLLYPMALREFLRGFRESATQRAAGLARCDYDQNINMIKIDVEPWEHVRVETQVRRHESTVTVTVWIDATYVMDKTFAAGVETAASAFAHLEHSIGRTPGPSVSSTRQSRVHVYHAP